MEKIVEVKGDRFFIKGCLNLKLKSLLPCQKCGFWNGEKCENPDYNHEEMDGILHGRWEIMKFEIPHDEIIIDTMPIPTNKVSKLKCKHCGMEIECKIPKWKEGECPSGELQHEFRALKEED